MTYDDTDVTVKRQSFTFLFCFVAIVVFDISLLNCR